MDINPKLSLYLLTICRKYYFFKTTYRDESKQTITSSMMSKTGTIWIKSIIV